MEWLDLVTLFATLLMCGNELAVSVFINPILWRRKNPEMTGEFARSLGSVMPVWYALCLLLLGAEAYLRRQEPLHIYLLAAAILWAAVIVYTISMLVPLNNQLASMSTGVLVTGWERISKRWDGLHRLRIALLIIAVVFFCLGLGRI